MVTFDFRKPDKFIQFDLASFNDASCDNAGITYSLVDENNIPVPPAYFTLFVSDPPYTRVEAPQGQYRWTI